MDGFNGARIPIWVKWQFVRVSYLVGNQRKPLLPSHPSSFDKTPRASPFALPTWHEIQFGFSDHSLLLPREENQPHAGRKNSNSPETVTWPGPKCLKLQTGSASLKRLDLATDTNEVYLYAYTSMCPHPPCLCMG